ncbi:hypothetical protein [Bradyrhizobium japonicum]|uniref:hypothetical protein n=1 Tax=Bradyrhizobium japonicum TaxID=375 RepID=UPI0027150806|nr:hypothetical protein [Bradyrhizobium japonicum]WLB53904.1 hypothetical protein QIH94_42995 [Bradyrhizobium japonicum]WLB64223.1 hypothetical protein QIH96_02795 [Bradyrhizobium japonicum]
MADDLQEEESGLLLAAEECPREEFGDYHSFTRYERTIIQRIMAHGPVLLRGGRGSGKSALLIESYLEMKRSYSSTIVPIYISLRHLPLLRFEGVEYEAHFCRILAGEINKEFRRVGAASFPITRDVGALLQALEANAREMQKRIVLLFDDAAHIGRERPLEDFFDIFRTISTSRISCKASIYPGVTKFGVRFDVFNDATVIDISRDERRDNFHEIFVEILIKRFPQVYRKISSSRSIAVTDFCRLMGRAVTGNLRSFVFACNSMNEFEALGYPELTKCFLSLSGNYFWPLLEEVAPKLGSYEVLVQPAQEIAHIIFSACARRRVSYVLVHRDIMQRQLKIYEILEYAGFVSKKEASRAMKSGGRGVIFSVNLCNLLEMTPGRRLTSELAQNWIDGTDEPFELRDTNSDYSRIEVPVPGVEQDLAILGKPIATLTKSNAYPYGLTEDKVGRLEGAGLDTILAVAEAPDEVILGIYGVGQANLRRIRDVVHQAIWM